VNDIFVNAPVPNQPFQYDGTATTCGRGLGRIQAVRVKPVCGLQDPKNLVSNIVGENGHDSRNN